MDRFVEILNDTFTIPELNKYIGNNVISGIDELNVQLDKSDLSRLIFSRENYEFFKKKENREKHFGSNETRSLDLFVEVHCA